MFKVKKLNVETMRTIDAYPQQFETVESARKYMETEVSEYAKRTKAKLLKTVANTITLTFKSGKKWSFFVTTA